MRRTLSRFQRMLRESPPQQPDAEARGSLEEKRLVVYQVVAARRNSYEAVLWQVPALSLTAQAFLLTIALGAGTDAAARRLASLLSLISALASIQLLSKHRHFEEVDTRLCEKLERDLDLEAVCGYLPHAGTRSRRQPDEPMLSGWVAYSSFKIWRLLLGLFALAALIAIALSFMGGSSE